MALLAAAGIVSALVACGYFPIRWLDHRKKRKAAPKGSLTLSQRDWAVIEPNPARSPAASSYFGDDLTFVAFTSRAGIQALPSIEISRFSTLLIKSGAKVIVPLALTCFPPMTCVPE